MTKATIHLPVFEFTEQGVPEPDAIEAYERDGVVFLRNAFSREWVDMLAEGMEIAIHEGTALDTKFNIAAPGETVN